MFPYIKKVYMYIETLPERLYPFASEVEGLWVRGKRSYHNALERSLEKYGPHHIGYRLGAYRATFHLFGSIIFLLLATFLAQNLFGSDVALYVMVCVAVLTLTLQEFYLDPKRYGQLKGKGVGDWLTWVVPMMVYVVFLISL